MKRRILALLLSSVLCLGIVVAAFAADDGGHWDFSDPDMGPQWIPDDQPPSASGVPSPSGTDTPDTSSPPDADTPDVSPPHDAGAPDASSPPDVGTIDTPSPPSASIPDSYPSDVYITSIPNSSGFPVSTVGVTTTATPTASVQGSTAAVTIGMPLGGEIVRQAVSSQSETVVIAPVIIGNVTRTEVSIPASAIEQLGSRTSASLSVSTPVASVTISNSGLSGLSAAGGTVTIAVEQTGSMMDLSITASGAPVEHIPGSVILTVPAINASPGTVAMLVYEDGTRETVRKSVAGKGSVTVPLDGPGRLELVDNSKYFADVPSDSWMADAVAFSSAHELFNGTGPAQFSPGLPMSRGMLAVVLHNLEGNPAQVLTGAFTDVSGGAWYAEGVAWAAAYGIVGGYGSGQFGPNDGITREQLAVMLWRYAGRPAAPSLVPHFIDADQASAWAMDALCWATGQGILKGRGSGILDPKGHATRAETAQMLKNFMERENAGLKCSSPSMSWGYKKT